VISCNMSVIGVLLLSINLYEFLSEVATVHTVDPVGGVDGDWSCADVTDYGVRTVK
jgi:hypothetical protein